MRESSDSPFIASSDWRTLLVGIVVIRAIVIIVLFLAPFTLGAASFLMPILDPIVSISIADDIMQVSFISTLVVLLWWSDAAGRVPVWAWAVVRILTPPPISVLEGWVLNDSHVQHGSEVLDLRVDLLAVLK
jgi:hypothetical protein